MAKKTIKTEQFKQTTQVVNFLKDLITIDKTERKSRKGVFSTPIDNYSKEAEWLNYCKFCMLFSRDNKFAYLNQDMLNNAIKGEFESFTLDSKSSKLDTLLKDYGLNAKLLVNFRKALNHLKDGRVVTDELMEMPENVRDDYYRAEEDIYNIVTFNSKKGEYVPINPYLTYTLNKDNTLTIRIATPQQMYTYITLCPEGYKFEFKTKPLKFKNTLGDLIENHDYYGVSAEQVIQHIRNAIAHNQLKPITGQGLGYEKYFGLNKIKDLEILIPQGWLMQFANYFTTKTFENIKKVNFSIDNKDKDNNKFVLPLYGKTNRLDTIEDVVHFLNSRKNYIITINDNLKHREVERILEEINSKLEGVDITTKYVDSLVKKTIDAKFKKADIKNYTITPVQNFLSVEQIKFLESYLNTIELFFHENLGEVDAVNDVIKGMSILKPSEKYDTSDFGEAKYKFIAQGERYSNNIIRTLILAFEREHATLLLDKDMPDDEEVMYNFYKKENPKLAEIYKSLMLLNPVFNANINEAVRTSTPNRTIGFFEKINYLDPQVEQKYRKALESFIEQTRQEYAEKHEHLAMQVDKVVARNNIPLKFKPWMDEEDKMKVVQEYINKLQLVDEKGYQDFLNYHHVNIQVTESKRIKNMMKRYDKEKLEFDQMLLNRKINIIKEMDKRQLNDMSNIVGDVNTHISESGMLQFFDVIDNLNLTTNKNVRQLCFEKNDLETLLINKRDTLATLALYQTYTALIESGIVQELVDMEGGRPNTPELIELTNEIKHLDFSCFDVTYTNKGVRSYDQIAQRTQILNILRTAIAHGNVKIEDYGEYNTTNSVLNFYTDNSVKGFSCSIKCKAGDLIELFSSPVFTREKAEGNARYGKPANINYTYEDVSKNELGM